MDDHFHSLRLCRDKFRLITFITYCPTSPKLYLSPHSHPRTDLHSYSNSNTHADSKST